MKVDRLTKPSTVTDAYWLIVNTNQFLSRHSGGKWLIFVSSENVDEAWNTIREATLNYLLGPRSKVATARPNPNAEDPNIKVICVYTRNYKDKKDVLRIRQALTGLGFTKSLNYKTNLATIAGRYGENSSLYRSDGKELIERTKTKFILPKGVSLCKHSAKVIE